MMQTKVAISSLMDKACQMYFSMVVKIITIRILCP